MFSPRDIYRRVKGRPFKPVRIRTSDGQTHDVYHPDLVIVGPRYVTVGTASAEAPEFAELETRVAIIQITALEDLPVPATPGGNGEAPST
jgi:hypothetical protein